jgi:predicted extracellular nuclease
LPSGGYCDGFAAVDDAGHEVAVDTYAYLGPKPRCRSAWADGASVLSLTGVWQQRRNGTTEQSVLALASCDGLNGEEIRSGTPAPPSEDIGTLQSAWAAGLRVTVIGVVVARWTSSSGAFGFALQDPGGAPRSGVRVFRGKSSTVPRPAPEIGDRVRVTARTGSARQLEL